MEASDFANTLKKCCFRTEIEDLPKIWIYDYNSKHVIRTGRLVVNAIITLTFMVPLALLSLRLIDRVVGIILIMVLCFVFEVLMSIFGPEAEDHQWLLIMGWVAIMGSFLANMP